MKIIEISYSEQDQAEVETLKKRLETEGWTVQLGGALPAPQESVPQNVIHLERSFTAVKKRWSNAFEKDFLVSLLSRSFGNVTSAAREAKIDRSNFLRLMRRHGLRSEAFRPEKEQNSPQILRVA